MWKTFAKLIQFEKNIVSPCKTKTKFLINKHQNKTRVVVTSLKNGVRIKKIKISLNSFKIINVDEAKFSSSNPASLIINRR